MRVLVVGRGGREHALAWKLAQSPEVLNVYVAPGNPGIATIPQCECVAIDELDIEEIVTFAIQKTMDLVVVGPEAPLSAGLVDALTDSGIPAFGPTKDAAQIEASKEFAKKLMVEYNIPTAAYASFTELEAAKEYIRKQGAPIVVKADGLAAGKGVIVAMTLEEALDAVDQIMGDSIFGNAGSRVVIEEFLEGEEVTIMAFVDGKTVVPMVMAQDHKPVFDNNEGPNTGGMGTYSPVPQFPASLTDEVVKTIIQPTVDALKDKGIVYKGVLYAGLMITKDGPKVIEFNARFGDPETQVVLPRLETEIISVFSAVIQGKLEYIDIEWSNDATVCIVMAAGGYPGTYEKGRVITGLEQIDREFGNNVYVFHAGTTTKDGEIVTNGGRVLGVMGRGMDLLQARDYAYQAIPYIAFEGAHYRTDIGLKGIKNVQ
ncbi:phosphoribosylamine--glycine ligase [Desulfuribacillus stibiiarsenatis]|uniref:Phosphoribosylamine--glycine ligase n=1 Tax=Desulfuribacillus stibiiarsenatis TaxID=1390249 RepID=A0A1E5L4Y8_9FIRM|nr:phosphoribosylamine--glycine ligase [Desulfuribacillus stibiiarsenatis]OEH85195.1 phosphoribosylamine--glycine ligase [Desulfuribacillus stibiiarsenatis]